MRYLLHLALTLALLAFVLITCSDNPTKPVPYALDEPNRVELGRSILIESEDLSLSFQDVNFDLRCPTTTSCRWSGMAEIRLKLRRGADSPVFCDLAILRDEDSTWTVNLGADTLGYQINLIALDPTPVAFHPVTHVIQGIVTATLVVSQTHNGARRATGPVRIVDLPVDSIPATDAEVISATLDTDTLSVTVKIANPCIRHYFELNMNPVARLESQPPEYLLWLRHTTHLAACVDERIELDLRFCVKALLEQVNRTTGLGKEKIFALKTFGSHGQPTQETHSFSYWGPESPDNHPPRFFAQPAISNRVGKPIEFHVRASDAEGVIPILTANSLPVGASFVDLETGYGLFRWTPVDGQEGQYQVAFSAFDGYLSDTLHVGIGVRSNLPPQITDVLPNDSLQVVRGSTIQVSIYAGDPDGDDLTYRAIGAPSRSTFSWLAENRGMVFRCPTETISDLVRSIAIEVSDGVLADTAMLVFNMLPYQAYAPTFSVAELNVTMNEGEFYSELIPAFDANFDPLHFGSRDLPGMCELASADESHARLTIDPNYRQHGNYELNIVVDDGQLADTLPVHLEILDKNAAPVLSRIGGQGCSENHIFSLELLARDPDGDKLTFSVTGEPDGMMIFPENDSSALLLYQWSGSDKGEHSPIVSVQDAIASDSEAVKFVVAGSASPTASLIPMAVGNYWVYESDVHETLRVVGAIAREDTTWWYLNRDFGPLTDKIRVSNDSVFSTYGLELFDPGDTTITFLVRYHSTSGSYIGCRASIVLRSITVQAGTFSNCLSFKTSQSGWCSGQSNEYIVAPGVGIILHIWTTWIGCEIPRDIVRSRELKEYHVETR